MRGRPRLMGRVFLLLVSLVVVGVMALPAAAVIDPTFDGDQHPNVGMIVSFDEFGGGIICTGTLVTPTIVLTAAHCVSDDPAFPPAEEYLVTFESELETNEDGLYVATPAIVGIPDPHPGYDASNQSSAGPGGTAYFVENSAMDIGLLHLTRPAYELWPGITPAPIIAAGALNGIKGHGPDVLQVGYGIQRFGPPGLDSSYFWDSTRNQSMFPIQKVLDSLLVGIANANNTNGFGSPCSGDSGSPWLLGNAIAGITSYGYGVCNNKEGAVRLDAGTGREFLRSRGLVP